MQKWKSYLLFILLNSSAPFLYNDFEKLHFNFYYKILQGQEKNKPRWELVLNSMDCSLGDIIGKKFIQEYGNKEIITNVEDMIKKFKLIFLDMVKDLKWMDQKTKFKVYKK